MMTLSSAIRLGAMLKPQGFGSASSDATAPRTCAMGAACEATGIAKDGAFSEMLDAWPFLKEHRACPSLSDLVYASRMSCRDVTNPQRTIDLLWHLNDGHLWTREQIASWIETIEAQHAPTSAVVPETVTA
jgi:hypothetical protein